MTSRILPKECKPASNKALRLPSRATSLTIVTRTKGNRNEFLIQNANSVSAFETNLPISCTLGHLIIGEVTQTPDVVTANKVNFQSPEGKDSDDRFALIKEALKICESEYIWFVDDDDLVNPDAAVEIATMLSLGNADIVQIDSQHFIGDLKQQGHRYRAKNFEASFMAPNQTPLCSIIYRTKFLKELISEKFNEITLLEDHFMYMIALASTASPVVSSPIIGSNIRLHENNSVVVRDTKQYSHASDLYKLWEGMVRIRFNQQLLISAQYYRKNIANQTPFIANLLRAVFSREAWRSVFYFKVLQRLLAKEISVRQLGIWLRRG